MAKIIRIKAESLNLPIVEINQPVKKEFRYEFNEKIGKNGTHCINHGEYRILIPKSSSEEIRVYDRDYMSFFPELDWLLEIFRLYKNKIPDIDESFVKEIYERKNIERLKPEIFYDEKGYILCIRGEFGSGKEETKVYFLSDYKLEFKSRMQNLQEWRSGDDGFSQPKKLNNNKEETISLKDLDILEKHIMEQIEQTNNEEKHKLQEFFQKIRSKILENQDKIDKIINDFNIIFPKISSLPKFPTKDFPQN